MTNANSNSLSVKRLCKVIAIIVGAAGFMGALAGAPFAASANWNVAGVTGIYFIAGAILITGGMITYAILLTKD